MNKEKINYRLLNLLILLSCLAILLITSNYWMGYLHKIIAILKPFIASFIVAYALYPFVNKLKHKGFNNGVSVTIIVLVVLIILLTMSVLTLPVIYTHLISFANTIVTTLTNITDSFDINIGNTSIRLGNLLDNMINNLSEVIPREGFNILSTSIYFLTQGLIIFILTIYFLIDMDKIRGYVKEYYLEKNKKFFYLIEEIDNKVGKYVSSLFLLMMITMLEYLILYRLIGHPNWLILGLLMAFAPIVPYIGGIIVNAIGILTAYTAGFPVFVGTLILLFVSSTIDGYIIGPAVHGKQSKIHPMVSIFAIVFFGAIIGWPALILGIPLYLIISTIWKFYRKDVKQKIEEIKND